MRSYMQPLIALFRDAIDDDERTALSDAGVPCRFRGKGGLVILDQIRTVDRVLLVKKLGRIDARAGMNALALLREIFEP